MLEILLKFYIDAVHTCENLCHEGECGQCSRTSKVYCRCALKLKVIIKKQNVESENLTDADNKT